MLLYLKPNDVYVNKHFICDVLGFYLYMNMCLFVFVKPLKTRQIN